MVLLPKRFQLFANGPKILHAVLLEIRELTVELPTAQGWASVNQVSLRLTPECVGLVGESERKTMLSLALMGLLPVGASQRAGEFRRARPQESGDANRDEWRGVRGEEIAMIFRSR
jgi:ABC-type glutathione transport system ATPase component